MSEFSEWNKQIIEEFRANGGKVGGDFEGAPVLLLHDKGRKSGKTYVHPLMYQEVGDEQIAVFGSKAGQPTHPDWYYNLIENPEVQAEIGTETVRFRARVAEGEERERIWSKQKADYEGFAGYEEATKGIREIPVIILEKADTGP